MYKRILIIAAVLGFIIWGVTELFRPTLYIGANSFAPMVIWENDQKVAGLDVELANEAAQRLGMKAKFQRIDWETKEADLNSGRLDAIWCGLSITDARREKMLITQGYLRNTQAIVVVQDSEIKQLADLKGKRVGVLHGVAISEEMKNFAISREFRGLRRYIDPDMAFLNLRMGHVDALVLDETVARYHTVLNRNGNYRILKDNFGEEEYGVAVSLQNSELLEKIQRVLDEMATDGTISRLSKKWLGADYTQ